jgi:hypothetical protein
LGTFGLPPDNVALSVLLVSLFVLGLGLRPLRSRIVPVVVGHPRTTIGLLAALATLLSLGYLAHYLGGGPRIIDATAYLYQAKLFASGHATLVGLEPGASFRGRFEYTDPTTLATSVIFPPGYAAWLALGVVTGAPLLVGPLLAAGLVLATAALARRVWGRDDVAIVAALLSTCCAALRYHTADTMSHGLAALLFAGALFAALGTGRFARLGAGLLLGWLMATRPVTGAVGVTVVGAMLVHHERSLRPLLTLGLGLIPGISGLLLYQHATTGAFLGATQLSYYRVADGPPGCFRYGLGRGIGCLFEHGSYVRARLPDGYGLPQAAWVTLLRLRWHTLDTFNFELLFAVVLIASYRALRHHTGLFLVLGTLGVVVAYAPFYFDGSYPGGGARFFADVLPLEHVWVAAWLVEARRLLWFLPLSLGGFSVHAAFEHQSLRLRDGGRPMVDSAVLDQDKLARSLVFVDTDHGFFLGSQPGLPRLGRRPVVARFRGDANDTLLFEQLGSPPTYRYRFDLGKGPTTPRLEPYRPTRPLGTSVTGPWHFEAESSWPLLRAGPGWVEPVYPPNDCTSARRALRFHSDGNRAEAVLALSVPEAGNYRVTLGWVAAAVGPYRATVSMGSEPHRFAGDQVEHRCFSVEIPMVTLNRGEHPVTVTVEEGELSLDSMDLAPLGTSAPKP